MTSKRKKKVSPSQQPKPDRRGVYGIFLLGCSAALLFSLLSFAYGHGVQNNWLGMIGYAIGKNGHALLGLSNYLICLFVGWIGWRLMFHKPMHHLLVKSIYFFIFVISYCVLLSWIEDRLPSFAYVLRNVFYPQLGQQRLRYHLGGAPFYYLYRDLPQFNLVRILNTPGVALLFSVTFVTSLMLLLKITPLQVWEFIRKAVKGFRALFTVPKPEESVPNENEESPGRYVALRIPESSRPNEPKAGVGQELLEIRPETQLKVRPSMSQKEKDQGDRTRTKRQSGEQISAPSSIPPGPLPKPQIGFKKEKAESRNFHGYALPSPSLLTNAKKQDQSALKQDLRRQAEVLEETLLSFGIEAKVGQINCGPTITSFEVHPALGVKVQKIKALENDIALNMEAKSIRIIAPIPGKAAVGIEVPNANPQEVGFKEMLLAYQNGSRKFHIPILLGKTVHGDYVMSDLTKMPHCIIAGATGAGKSVCINVIVMTILMTARPDEIKLLMVDPKKVELTPYTLLPHMLAPVITEPQGACAALNWLVKEMESRYELLKHLGVRNIEAFNTRKVNPELEAALEREIPARLPYIVLIIDELADLMMVASNDIETPIARIAQMARAVGIHMILATQRPSREVITGLIKANFPTRISFKVASRINSQIILDETGAESLLGNGDTLFLPPGSSTTVRAQGAFVRDEDMAAVVQKITAQSPPNYLIPSFDKLGLEEKKDVLSGGSGDQLYDQALEVVLSSGNASTTFLQRKLKVGYARAASLMDALEEEGVIGMGEGKARKVLKSKQNVGTGISSSDLPREKNEE